MTPSARSREIARNCAGAIGIAPEHRNPVRNFLNALNGGLNEIKRCLVGVPRPIRARAAGTPLLAAFAGASCRPAEPFRENPPPELADWYECLGRNRDGGGIGGTGLRDEICLLLVAGRAREGRYGGCADSPPKPDGRSAPDPHQERKSNEQDE